MTRRRVLLLCTVLLPEVSATCTCTECTVSKWRCDGPHKDFPLQVINYDKPPEKGGVSIDYEDDDLPIPGHMSNDDKYSRISALNLKTQKYDPICEFYGIQFNACGINPADSIIYCQVLSPRSIARVSCKLKEGHITQGSACFIAKDVPPSYSAGFDKAGTYFYIQQSKDFSKVFHQEDIKSLTGYSTKKCATSLAGIEPFVDDPSITGNDIVILEHDMDKDGTIESYILSCSKKVVHMQCIKDCPGDTTGPVITLKTQPLFANGKSQFGATWRFKDQVYCSANNPGGVWEVYLDKIDVPGKSVEVGEVSYSEKTDSNDGYDCEEAESKFPDSTVAPTTTTSSLEKESPLKKSKKNDPVDIEESTTTVASEENLEIGLVVNSDGLCILHGDPHIATFDGLSQRYLGEGVSWLVRTDNVHIQATFYNAPFPHATSVIQKLAVGGPFMGGGKLLIEPRNGGQISFKHLADTSATPILTEFPSAVTLNEGECQYNAEGSFHEGDPKRIVHCQLPHSVQVHVMRWPLHLDVQIVMPGESNPDGLCGNFNGDPDDDHYDQVFARMGHLEPSESLLEEYAVRLRSRPPGSLSLGAAPSRGPLAAQLLALSACTAVFATAAAMVIRSRATAATQHSLLPSGAGDAEDALVAAGHASNQ